MSQPANCDTGLVLTLKDTILKDQSSRTGYISSNFQLQFDSPPQAGSLAHSGFTLCHDGNLALNGTTTFFECPTGDAWNLYDRRWAEHCGAVRLAAKRCGEVEAVEGETVAVPTKVITELSDGQAQVKSTSVGKVVCQLEDGGCLFTFLMFWLFGEELTACRPGPGTRLRLRHDAGHRHRHWHGPLGHEHGSQPHVACLARGPVCHRRRRGLGSRGPRLGRLRCACARVLCHGCAPVRWLRSSSGFNTAERM